MSLPSSPIFTVRSGPLWSTGGSFEHHSVRSTFWEHVYYLRYCNVRSDYVQKL